MNPLVWIILDSCRYDSFVRAATPNLDAFAAANGTAVERRWSYASFTAPSHYAFLMGLVPHTSPPGVVASEVYRKSYAQWSRRLGIEQIDFARFLPHLSLPRLLGELGYRTIARVSLPVLNQATLLSTHFHDYRLMDHHADFAGMIRDIQPVAASGGKQPAFHFFNLGETHYPYMLGDKLPRLSGVHGTLKHMSDPPGSNQASLPFDTEAMIHLHAQQSRCVEHVDQLFGEMLQSCAKGTHIIVTADHGELFGEQNYFGHGPIMHEKVFEVPFLEGRVT